MTEDKVVDKHKYGQTKDNLPAVFMSGNRKQCEYQAPWFTLPHQPEVLFIGQVVTKKKYMYVYVVTDHWLSIMKYQSFITVSNEFTG